MTTDERLDSQLSREVIAGQAVYSRRVLRMYDWLVLGLSNRFVWRCPTQQMQALYDQHVTSNHLEVGVGTGYFLDRCRFPTGSPRIVLMDLNENCLRLAARRIRRYGPRTVRRNILEPIPWEERPFDSIGLNYVLHCLPGGMEAKAAVFDHLAALLNPRGVLFGSTLLTAGVRRHLLARWLMTAYNHRRIFCNTQDSLETLTSALKSRFSEQAVWTLGCAALFWGRESPSRSP